MKCTYTFEGKVYETEDAVFEAVKKAEKPEAKKIYDRLLPIFQAMGIKIESLRNYEKITGTKLDEDVRALADLGRKIVAFNKDEISADTLPEELAHFVLPNFEGTPEFEYLMENIEQLPEYQKVYEQYYTKYNGDVRMIKMEVAGKMLADHILKGIKREQSHPIIRVLRNLWNKFKKMISNTRDLETYLESIADNILTGRDIYNVQGEGVYYELTYSLEKELQESITSLEGRLQSMEKRKLDSGSLKKKINVLKEKLENAEFSQGLALFVKYANEDGSNAMDYIKKVRNGDKKLSAKLLMQLNDFLAYYQRHIDTVAQIVNETNLISENLNDALKTAITTFYDVKNFIEAYNYKQAVDILDNFYEKEFSISKNSPDFYQKVQEKIEWDYRKELKDTHRNSNFFEYWFGSMRDASDHILQVAYTIVKRVSDKVRSRTTEFGKQILERAEAAGLDTSSMDWMFEKYNGKRTGYFLDKYKNSEFRKDWNDFKDALRTKYKLKEFETEPSDPKELIKFNEDKNKWLSENANRRFIREYYDKFNKLSMDTKLRREKISAQIYELVNQSKDVDGNIDLSKLTEEEYNELRSLNRQRKNLASMYYSDTGELKEGIDADIAKELTELNEELYDNVDYEKNIEKYKLQKAAKKKQLSPEEFKKWVKRNEEIVYDQEFWDLLEQIERTDYGDEYAELNEEKNALLRLFSDSGMQARRPEEIPDKVKKRIIELEKELEAIREQVRQDRKDSGVEEDEGGLRFNNIAEIEVMDNYGETLREKQDSLTEEQYREWYDLNHVRQGVPAPFWTYIKPKNEAYIRKEPNKYWSEVSSESTWYNPNFDETYIGLQPGEKYINPEFANLDQNKADFLQYIKKLKAEMDSKLPSRQSAQNLAPQIRSSILDIVFRKNPDMFRTIGRNIRDELVTKEEDEAIFGEKFRERPDGSIQKYVPTYYTTLLGSSDMSFEDRLNETDQISTDIIGTMVAYKEMQEKYVEMSKLAPEMEVLQAQVGERKYKGEISGSKTMSFKAFEKFNDMNLYGMNKNLLEVSLAGRKYNLTKVFSKLNAYVRAVNLGWNFFTTMSNYIQSEVFKTIEALTGQYTTKKSAGFAEIEWTKNLPSIIGDTMEVNKNNKLWLIMERFNLVKGDPTQAFRNLDKGKLIKKAVDSGLYWSYELVDFNVKGKIAIAVLHDIRLYNGEWLSYQEFKNLDSNQDFYKLPSAYDTLQVENKRLVGFDEDMMTKLSTKVEYVANMIDGKLTKEDYAAAHQDAILQLVTTHRSWLFSGLQRRFKNKGYNYMTGVMDQGFYRTTANFLYNTVLSKERVLSLNEYFHRWNELSDMEKAAVKRTMYEMLMTFAFIAIAKMLNAAAEDDEDYIKDVLAYMSNRAVLEVGAFTPLTIDVSAPWTGGSIIGGPLIVSELFNTISNPVVPARNIEMMFDYGDILFGGEEVERGQWKGYSKRQRAILRMVPIYKSLVLFNDPNAANNFLKNKPLRMIY